MEYLLQAEEGHQHGWRSEHKLTKDVTAQVEWRKGVAVDPAYKGLSITKINRHWYECSLH